MDDIKRLSVNISPTINIAAMIITYSTKSVFFKTQS